MGENRLAVAPIFAPLPAQKSRSLDDAEEPFKPNEVKEGLHEVSVAPRRPGGSVMARYVPPPAKTRIKAKRAVVLPICATRHRVVEAAAARVSPDAIAKIFVQLGGTVVATSIAAAPVTTAAPASAIS